MFTVAAPTEPLEDGRTIDRRYHSDIAPNQIGSAPRSVCFFQPSLLATWTRLAPRATAVCYETYKAFVHDRQRAPRRSEFCSQSHGVLACCRAPRRPTRTTIRPDPLRPSCLS